MRSFKLATIPRSEPDTEKTGFYYVFQKLKADSRFTILNSGKNILERHKAIPKQTSTKVRNIEQHLNSLQARHVNQNDAVILLDDVITSGCSMKASIHVLEKAGANVLWGIAFAKTTY